MTITTTYAWRYVQSFDLTQGPSTSQARLTRLSNGGFAAVGNHVGHTDVDIFGADLSDAGGANVINGTDPSVTQLANGNLVVVSQDADSILYQILNGTGGNVLAQVDIGDTNSTNPDVAALTGGRFVVVNQDNFSATDNDIDFRIYDSAGTAVGSAFSVDSSGASDINPSVAALDNGNFAIAWQRDVGAESEIWYAVYDANGAAVQVATLLDTTGTINRNPVVTATNGGFAIVYEDNGWTGTQVDVTLATFNPAGGFITWINATQTLDNSNIETPTITRLTQGGFLAVSWGNNAFSDTDQYVVLFNATGTTALTNARAINAGNPISNDATGFSLVGFGLGQVAVVQTDITASDTAMEILQVERTTTSDGASDDLIGDNMVDIMLAGSGNDGLYGNNNNDELYGQAGNDYMSGGNGNDYMSGGSENDVFFGGGGIDTMIGGAGNDEYYIGATDLNDIIVEYAGEGNDRIFASVSYYLAAGSEIETVGTDNNSGNANINLGGSNLANTMIGNNGSNLIDGGLGNDILYGLGGTDYFTFSSAPNNASNVDTIADFASVDDLIFLDDAIFTGIAGGFLSASAFGQGAGLVAATTAGQRILHDTATGDLYYDADGVGGVAAVRFATIGAGTSIFNYDFFVY